MSKLLLDPASHLLLHPTMNTLLKVLSTTTGRDKLQRGVQYYARLLAYVYERQGLVEESKRWNGIKGTFSNARKVLRTFKFLEHLQSALRLSISAQPGDWAQITQIARQIAYAGFLFFDSVAWSAGASVRLINLSKERAEKANKLGMRFWLAGITLSLVNGFQRFSQIRAERRRLRLTASAEKDASTSDAEKKLRLQTLNAEQSAVRIQFVQDVLDFCLPASNLGIVSVSDGIAGAFGTVTSFIGFYLAWQKASGK